MHKSRKYVFLQVTPVFDTFVKKWCIDELYSLGVECIICDLTQVVNPRLDAYLKQKRLESDKYVGIEVCKIKSYTELNEFFLQNCESRVFFTMFYNAYETRKIFSLIKETKVDYVCLTGVSSELGIDDTINDELSLIKKMRLQHIKAVLYNRLLRKVNTPHDPLFIVLSSRINENYQCWRNDCENVERVRLHSYDYENYLRTKPYANSESYVVFLDSNVPYHPDFVVDSSLKVDEKEYYKQLNEIFDEIERKLGLKVIIAAHPRADIEIETKMFDNRKIVLGDSAALIKGACLVLAHFSNSIAFGVMAHKPITLICNEELVKVEFFKNKCYKYSRALKLPIIHDGSSVDESLLIFDDSMYEKFLMERITYEEKDEPCFWKDIVLKINNKYNMEV